MTSTAANRGKRWERQLEAWHRSYLALGAYVARTPPPVKVLSRIQRGTFTACFESGGPPDYMGVVDGRSVVFDAKETRAPRWGYASLEVHQAQAFDQAQAAGSFVFIALRMAGVELVVPWSQLGPMWWTWHRNKAMGHRARAGEASLGRDEALIWCARMGRDGWLSAVRCAMGAA